MTRILAAAAATLLLSTGLGLANGLVPGSDTSVRGQQSIGDTAVATGHYASRERADTRFGYPTTHETIRASDQADDRAANRTAGAPVSASSGILVPGSDSF
ncbi:hypothetical protein [Aureimonas sp. ME7]|uniref:hypothetical protein n=1 Tax=Aureimonas sp. ME7 TaxID=2744252 RepID=UPI0015F417D4|nr:hypothetical protein [Aureimonas sp. ME7]